MQFVAEHKTAKTEYRNLDIPIDQLLQSLIKRLDDNANMAEHNKNTLLNVVIDGKRYRLLRHDVQDEVHLSPREEEVAYYLSQGLLVKEIARKLKIKKSTITTYVSRIYAKLNVNTRADMVRVVLTRGLVSGYSHTR